MNTALPNIDRSAAANARTDARKEADVNERDSGFEKVIDKVQGQNKTPDPVKKGAEDKEKPQSDEGNADGIKEPSDNTKALKDLIRQASSTQTAADANKTDPDTATSEDSAKVLDAENDLALDEGPITLQVEEEGLYAKLKMQQVISGTSIGTAQLSQKMSALAGVVNAANPVLTVVDGKMAQVLNGLGTKLTNPQSDANTQKQAGISLSELKAGQATASVETVEAVNLPKTKADANNRLADTQMKSGMLQAKPDAASGQSGSPAQTGGEVKVVSVETHLPPATEVGRPALQVASALSKQVSSATARADAAQDISAQIAHQQNAKPIKSLEIQLRPDNLGVVRANIQIRGGELEISLVTSTPEAAEMLKGDRQALARVLQDAGYRTEASNISITFKEEVSDQMRQPGQNQERFTKSGGSDGEAGEGSSGNPWEENSQTEHAGAGQGEADTKDLRDGIYL
ncbi:flagellar hook-length control protein FliK [Pseudovibrio sp. Tun.PSC04-5.I4]|uniref:flagellar hook-length control protein FliK n=1 Tax=Pseudovibrio sp. Tun.PSC04-5.I4 TaxID=1798213 RepID=UPI00087E2919|nr:flagellar hook-length control protein FliK [Pseudovibrio sp. Tun.PSC04-5.I4]SDQ92845.1 chemotaxis protein MotD [Pseudovibrio sp. Tun.PSC04-5.I4]